MNRTQFAFGGSNDKTIDCNRSQSLDKNSKSKKVKLIISPFLIKKLFLFEIVQIAIIFNLAGAQ